jgi:hypothetical protein
MTTTQNLLLLHHNLADEATVTASSQISGAEATFVQEMEPGEPWRATGKVSETLTFDHGAAGIDATHAAIVAHNLNTQGTISFACGNDPTFASTVYAVTDADAWDPISGFGYDSFGMSLGGYPVLNARNDYRPFKYFDLGGRRSFRYSRFTFKNPTNTSITGVAVGRAFVGLGSQFLYNFARDWGNDWVDPSEHIDTEHGTLRIKRRRKYRVLKLSLPFLSEGEALSVMDDIKRVIGSSRDVIAVPFPTGGAPKRYRTSTYGIPVDRQGVTNPFLDVFRTSLFIRELAA